MSNPPSLMILRNLRYHGVAHLDFRRDRRDGQVKLLDFNPRIAGSNEISIKSGVNFALMPYRLALGERVKPCFSYQAGLEFRWLLGELQHFVKARDKWHNLRDLLRWSRARRDLSLIDPLPHAVRVLQGLRRLPMKTWGIKSAAPTR